MKKRSIMGGILIFLALSGCGDMGETASPAPPDFTAPVVSSPDQETPIPEAPAQAVTPKSAEEVRSLLRSAMEDLTQPPLLELSEYLGEEPLEQSLKNIYYDILAQHPELRYTYDLSAEVTPEGLVLCSLSYMPYRLGTPGREGEPVSTLSELIAVAEAGLGDEDVKIRITNPQLDVEDMSRALQQVGSGYLVCAINQDATAIEYSPATGYTMAECLTMLEEARTAAQALVLELTTPEMGELARLSALYTWLTDTVKYDHRYYADRNSLPFTATTATGAFEDHLAICGGYAHGLELLCKAAGLEVYTVSGQAAGEYHMWNLVRVDSRWVYCDPTFDRNTSRFGFRNFCVDAEALAKDHQWDAHFLSRLTGDEE